MPEHNSINRCFSTFTHKADWSWVLSCKALIPKLRPRRGLWRGTTPTVVRLSCGAGLHFLFLDSIRGVLEKRHPDGNLSRADTFFMGGAARAGSALIMCPITVIKTRMEYGGTGGTQYRVCSYSFGEVQGYRGV